MDGFKRPAPPRPDPMLPPSRRPDGFVPRPLALPVINASERPLIDSQTVDYRQTPTPTSQSVEDIPQLVSEQAMQLSDVPRPKKRRHRLAIGLAISLGVALVVGAGGVLWYYLALKPASSDKNAQTVSLEVSSGETWQSVARTLAQKRAITSELAFSLYARLHGGGLPQATCLVSPSDSTQEIYAQITDGCKNTSYTSVTFYPGATIETPLYKPANSQIDAAAMSVRTILGRAGYDDAQIAAALTKQYSGELFQDKPEGTTLEGYIYGETYHISAQASADKVLQIAFDQMLSDLKKYNLITQFKERENLNLYQAITLASIVQRELNCEDKPTPERKERCYQYQRSIAQVFLTRLKLGMTLGSDVTFIYAADQLKVQPTPTLDSPYNTRIHAGLPPGPIASPGLLALRAVADPTPTDYLFFIAGDDGLIYFAKTDAEHQENIKNHCQQLCSEL